MQLIMNFLVLPLFFLSGALFPLDNIPKVLSVVTRIDPLTYGVDGLRGILIGVSHFGVVTDVIVLLGTAALLLCIGAWRFSQIVI